MDDTALTPLILNWLLQLRGYIGYIFPIKYTGGLCLTVICLFILQLNERVVCHEWKYAKCFQVFKSANYIQGIRTDVPYRCIVSFIRSY